jgi:hypothetical protein
MIQNLTVSDVTTWLRKQAREFNRIADTLEQTFSSPLLPPSSPIHTSNNTPVRAQHIATYLKKKGASRAKSMAEFFCVPVDTIDTLIAQNEHLFEIGERGWIKLISEPSNGAQKQEEVDQELNSL